MSKTGLFALLLLLTVGAMELEQTPELTCYKYTCNDNLYAMPNSTCTMYKNGTFYLQLCTDKETPYCPPTNTPGTNSTCQMNPAPPVGNAWPGEKCKSLVDCVEGTCTNGVCVGSTQGGACLLNDECNPGLYCSSNVCTPQIALGKACQSDYQCVNNAGCDFSSGTGVCTQYLSLDYYSPVAPCNNNVNYLCGSGTCATNTTNSYCIPEPESYAQPPLKCINNGDCFSLPDPIMGTVLNSNCTCSYNPWGMSFCQLFPGDEIGITMRKYLYTWFLNPNATKCNTVRRMSLQCIQQYYNEEDYLWLAYHEIWYNDFSLVQFLDPCGQQIYQQDYWSIKYLFNHYNSNFTDTDDYSAGQWLHVAVLGTLALVA